MDKLTRYQLEAPVHWMLCLIRSMIAQQGLEVYVEWSPTRVCLQVLQPALPLDGTHLREQLEQHLAATQVSAYREAARGLCSFLREKPHGAWWWQGAGDGEQLFSQAARRPRRPAPPRPAPGWWSTLLIERGRNAQSWSPEVLADRCKFSPVPIYLNHRQSQAEYSGSGRWKVRAELTRPGRTGRALHLPPAFPTGIQPDVAIDLLNPIRPTKSWKDAPGGEGAALFMLGHPDEPSLIWPAQAGVLLPPLSWDIPLGGLQIVCDVTDQPTDLTGSLTASGAEGMLAELTPTALDFLTRCVQAEVWRYDVNFKPTAAQKTLRTLASITLGSLQGLAVVSQCFSLGLMSGELALMATVVVAAGVAALKVSDIPSKNDRWAMQGTYIGTETLAKLQGAIEWLERRSAAPNDLVPEARMELNEY